MKYCFGCCNFRLALFFSKPVQLGCLLTYKCLAIDAFFFFSVNSGIKCVLFEAFMIGFFLCVWFFLFC